MPTVYHQQGRSLKKNRVNPRDLEIWEKHCEEKNLNPKKTKPLKHPKKVV